MRVTHVASVLNWTYLVTMLLHLLQWQVVLAESAVSCHSNCFNHGTCNQGVCECYDGWFGQHCEQKLEVAAVCMPACAHGGRCVSGKCECPHGFTGVDCSKVALSPAFLKMLQDSPTGASDIPGRVAEDLSSTSSLLHVDGPANREPAVTRVTAGTGGAAAGSIYVAREAVRVVSNAAELLGDMATARENRHKKDPDNEDAASRMAAMVSTRKGLFRQKQPSAEATVHCEAGCSGHGVCEDSGKCSCATGWTGSICDMPLCPGNCNSRGLCVQGNCVCEAGWYGASCHLKRCPNDCSGAGYCFEGKCKCMNGFEGDACEQVQLTRQSIVVKLKHSDPLKPRSGTSQFKETSSLRSLAGASCPDQCNHRGQCSPGGKCRCDAGYSGVACESFCPNECSGQGRCIEGGCLCFAGFTGADCSVPGCCSGHGTCDVPGTCECEPGWGGPECSVQLVCADPTCSGHGTCLAGSCHCEDGWAGPRCAAATGGCEPQCGPTGHCNMQSKQCECEPGYAGADCTLSIAVCPNNCNFKGVCLNGVCMCGAGWNGEDCSRRYFAPGGAATTALGDAEDAQSGANFAIETNGQRADIALDEAMGPEPRIDLKYEPATLPETDALPGVPLEAAVPKQIASDGSLAAGTAQAATQGEGGAMSPQAVSPGMALESAQVVSLGRLASQLDDR